MSSFSAVCSTLVATSIQGKETKHILWVLVLAWWPIGTHPSWDAAWWCLHVSQWRLVPLAVKKQPSGGMQKVTSPTICPKAPGGRDLVLKSSATWSEARQGLRWPHPSHEPWLSTRNGLIQTLSRLALGTLKVPHAIGLRCFEDPMNLSSFGNDPGPSPQRAWGMSVVWALHLSPTAWLNPGGDPIPRKETLSGAL